MLIARFVSKSHKTAAKRGYAFRQVPVVTAEMMQPSDVRGFLDKSGHLEPREVLNDSK